MKKLKSKVMILEKETAIQKLINKINIQVNNASESNQLTNEYLTKKNINEFINEIDNIKDKRINTETFEILLITYINLDKLRYKVKNYNNELSFFEKIENLFHNYPKDDEYLNLKKSLEKIMNYNTNIEGTLLNRENFDNEYTIRTVEGDKLLGNKKEHSARNRKKKGNFIFDPNNEKVDDEIPEIILKMNSKEKGIINTNEDFKKFESYEFSENSENDIKEVNCSLIEKNYEPINPFEEIDLACKDVNFFNEVNQLEDRNTFPWYRLDKHILKSCLGN